MNFRYFWYVPVFAVLLVACHDAPRNNPFDPELTPRVEEVAAQVDTAAGSVLLEWSEYEGDQPFSDYRILRRVQGLVAVDTVGLIKEVAQTSFTDTSIVPDLAYVYQIVVVNQEGFEVPSSEVVVRSFSVREVDLLEVRSDSLKGTISLHWQPYSGPDFVRYEVWRRNFGQDPLALDEIEDVEQTTWIDENPLPATEYSYWVKLLAAGKELESQRREISYELPPIELHQVEFSSEDASSRLEWTRYQGPRFAAYEVRRKSGDLVEQNRHYRE